MFTLQVLPFSLQQVNSHRLCLTALNAYFISVQGVYLWAAYYKQALLLPDIGENLKAGGVLSCNQRTWKASSGSNRCSWPHAGPWGQEGGIKTFLLLCMQGSVCLQPHTEGGKSAVTHSFQPSPQTPGTPAGHRYTVSAGSPLTSPSHLNVSCYKMLSQAT